MQAEQAHFVEPTDRRPSTKSSDVFRPDSPFLPEPEYATGTAGEAVAFPVNEAEASTYTESPFVSEYTMGETEFESAEALMRREVLDEIFDTEFDEAVDDLVNELRAVNDNRFVGETSADPLEAERFLEAYVDPLRQEIETSIDRMISEADALGEAPSELQFEQFIDQFNAEATFSNPAFENFFKKLFKKVKKAAKAGLKVVKKVGKVLSKFSPIHLVLRKVKKLARPLIKRVLKFALNKLPRRFRPLARKLARRFLGKVLREGEESEALNDNLLLQENALLSDALATDAESTAPSTKIIAAEFDEILTGYLIDRENYEADPAVNEYFSGAQYETATDDTSLQNARDRFIQRLENMEEGEDPAPAVEEFVTAILAAVRIGIKIIGRKRVVNFLAKFVAKIIRRFVGKRSAKPLSRALVDAGLKLVSLENPEEVQRLASETLANTIQETVQLFSQQVPDDVFEDEAALEHYANVAFEKAVVANFPTQLIRPSLRDTPRLGVWVRRPGRKKRKRFKKFSKIIRVRITPQKARAVMSFGRRNLHGFMKEQLGLPMETEAVDAQLHLYEAVQGTTLSAISHAENDVPGLGTGGRLASAQFHPLTPEAAAVLIPEDAGLGRETEQRFLFTRRHLGIGQRFYFLEIPGARVMQTNEIEGQQFEAAQPVRASEINVMMNFAERRIDVMNYLSEAACMDIVKQLRSGHTVNALVTVIEKTLSEGLRDIFTTHATSRLLLRREAQISEGFVSALAPMLKTHGAALAQRITQWIVSHMLKQQSTQSGEIARVFQQATVDPADGVTITFQINQIDQLMGAMAGRDLSVVAALRALLGASAGAVTYTIRPGFHKSSGA